jgi:hypothetical protein
MRFDTDTASRSRGIICPSCRLGSPRKEGAGNAGCALHPRSRVQWVDGSAHEHTGSAEALRHSLRNGFTAYTCSSRRRIPFATVTSGLRFVLSPVGPTRLRRLDISHGCQNHTTSPYAAPSPAPPIGEMPTEVLATALKRRSSARRWIAHGRPRPATTIAPDAAASTASNPASVTIAIRPSCRGGRAK